MQLARAKSVLVISALLLVSAAAQQPPAPAAQASAKIPPEILERVRAELLDDADLQDCLQEDRDEPVKYEEVLTATQVDLGGDRHGLVVRGRDECLCSSAANCDVWVFQTGGPAPVLLLRASAVEAVVPQESTTGGYRDLLTSTRTTGADADLFLYKFDGKEYRLQECQRRTYTDVQGHRVKQPRIISITCEPHSN